MCAYVYVFVFACVRVSACLCIKDALLYLDKEETFSLLKLSKAKDDSDIFPFFTKIIMST